MPNIKVVGGERLQGHLRIQGSKNGSLPILAATILNKGITRLRNCPRIIDVYHMIEILKTLGCKIQWEEDVLTIDSTDIISNNVSEDYVSKLRSSVLFIGALLGRNKEVNISYPGGCSIGSRPIDYHFEAFERMNIKIIDIQEEGCLDKKLINCKTTKILGADINLRFPSVGATQNIILAAVLAEGTVKIFNAAKEPEVDELCNFLNKAGAKIRGIGSNRIIIEGVNELKDIDYTLTSDRIVAGTYMSAIAATGGELILLSPPIRQLESTIRVLKKIGCTVDIKDDYLRISSDARPKAIGKLETSPYPGFPTDMQSQLMSVLSCSDGNTVLKENIFESRFQNVNELIKMGANIIIKDSKTVEIFGVSQLYGAELVTHDLRSGAALVIAALVAEGTSTIKRTELIDRGYVDIVADLQALGAKIKYNE